MGRSSFHHRYGTTRRRRKFTAITATSVVIASLVFTGQSDAFVNNASGNALTIAAPISVTPTGAGDATRVLVFNEQQGVTLAAPLKIDFRIPGTYTGSIPATFIAAGTQIDSHFIQSNRKGTGTNVREATVTFAQDILGVIATRSKLADSDILGAAGTSYGGAYPSRELEFDKDYVQIVNARTLFVHLDSSTIVDQIRVVTKHNDVPTANAGGPYAGPEGSAVTLGGSASDPDGDALTYQWVFSVSGGAGVVCTTSNTTTLTPSVTCNDDAIVTATMSAQDSYHAPVVSAPRTVTIGNVAPTIATLTLPGGQIPIATNVVLSATYADVSSNDTHSASIDWGDTNTSVGTVVPLSHTISGNHNYTSDGMYTVTLTVTDDNGGFVARTGTVTINGAPNANAHGPYSGGEGTTVNLTGTATDPSGDPLTNTWTFTPGPADPGTTCNTTGANTLTPTVVCNDDVVVDAVLTTSDGINPSVTSNTSVTVTNAAPLVAPIAVTGGQIAVGATVSASALFGDPATNDTHTASINWGDLTSSAALVSETNGVGTASGTHVYAAPGNYTITLSVTDDNGGTDQQTVAIVINAPPSINAGGPYAGFEGSASTLTATATDGDGDPLTIGWTFTWTGAGVQCIASGTNTLTPQITCDDDTTVTATLTVTDGINAPVVSVATLAIGNVSPIGHPINLTPNNVQTNTTVNLSVGFSDAGTHDTHTATIDWGDGNTTTGIISEINGAGTVTGSHQYAVGGAYTVTVTVTDDNGGAVTLTAPTGVTVNDPPTANPAGPYTGNEGTAVALSGSGSDPEGDPLTFAWTFMWTGPGVQCVATGATTATPSITCDDNTLVTATLTTSDGPHFSNPVATTIAISNVNPTAGALAVSPGVLAVGASANASVTFADAGTHDTHTALVDWDDGASTTASIVETNGTGTAGAAHVYIVPGIYTVSVTVTDDDSGSVIATAASYIVVFNPSAGHITTSANGFISPSGAYTPNDPGDPNVTGQSFLGINLEYASPMATLPSGVANFRFTSGNILFAATSFSWLVVDPLLNHAWFRGAGTVNGVGGYDFLVSVVDGHPSPDFVRVQITVHATGAVLYDSQPGAADDALPTTPTNQGFLRILS